MKRILYRLALWIAAVFMFLVDWFAAEYFKPVKKHTIHLPAIGGNKKKG